MIKKKKQQKLDPVKYPLCAFSANQVPHLAPLLDSHGFSTVVNCLKFDICA